MIKKDEEHLYSEKIVYLPEIWNCHSGLKSERKEATVPFIKNKYLTFCSFNNFCKINDKVILAWSEILKKIKNSRLILKPSGRSHSSRLKNAFKKNGVEKSVYFYENIRSVDDHLKLYNEVDIALDTFPYNGVTTSFEAIWMGVPVLTMRGYNFNSRCGESINNNMGLTNLIATSIDDYVNIAHDLSVNTDKLINIRKQILRMRLRHHCLMEKILQQNFLKLLKILISNYECQRKYRCSFKAF